mgnify:CR=1 FL=1
MPNPTRFLSFFVAARFFRFTQAVSCTYVSIRQTPERPWESVGRTEVVIDEPNPSFHRTFELVFSARRRQQVKFDIWDVSDKTGSILKGATLYGSVDFALVRVVRLHGQPLKIPLLDKKGRPVGDDAALTVEVVSIKRFKEAPQVRQLNREYLTYRICERKLINLLV